MQQLWFIIITLHVSDKFQKGVHYMGVKIFNKLPPKIQYLSNNKKQFHKTLKKFLLLGSFYTLEEFYNWSSISELRAADRKSVV